MASRIGLDIRILRQAWRHLLETTTRKLIISQNSRPSQILISIGADMDQDE
jgi:hypothetical protein